MAEFLKGNELNSEIGKIFTEAQTRLLIVSPYIKLHHRFKDELKEKLENDKLDISILFGKNNDDPSKSISIEEIEFFKQFPFIEIRYEERLHAKFYANEFWHILTSMNLYDYSQDKNLEAGIKSDYKIIGSNSLFDSAMEYFEGIINRSELLFKKTPQYESKILGKKYTTSLVEFDNLSKYFSEKPLKKRDATDGYCIRTGVKIPFNLSKPYSLSAFESWNKYKNEEYPEKYCHKTGKTSNGKTSKKNPVLLY